MRPVQSLESRIQRAAEDFGCPVLRRAALEVGEVVAERDRLRRSFKIFSWLYYLIAGFSIGSGLAQIARHMGWL